MNMVLKIGDKHVVVFLIEPQTVTIVGLEISKDYEHVFVEYVSNSAISKTGYTITASKFVQAIEAAKWWTPPNRPQMVTVDDQGRPVLV